MDGQAGPAGSIVFPRLFPKGATLDWPTSLWNRVDIGSACWARTSDPLINSHRVVDLRANNCADFTLKPSGKIKKFATILCAFAAVVPELSGSRDFLKGPHINLLHRLVAMP